MEGERMEILTTIVCLIVSVFLTYGLAARKPKFEVNLEPKKMNLHWFRLEKNAIQELNLKRVIFAHGSTLEEAGYSVPENSHEKLCAMVFSTARVPTEGIYDWEIALMTQSFITELYLKCINSVAEKTGKYTPKSEALVCADDFDLYSMCDDFTVDLELVISHLTDPTNKGRTRYELKTNE